MTKVEETFDYYPLVASAFDVDANGVIEIEVGSVPSGFSWLIERIAIRTSDGFNAALGVIQFELHATITGGRTRTSLRDFTPLGGEAAADEANPLRFWQNETILARWSGLTAAATTWASIYMQVRVVADARPAPEAGGEEGAGAEREELVPTPPPLGWD